MVVHAICLHFAFLTVRVKLCYSEFNVTTVILAFGTRYLKPFIRRGVKPFVVLDGFSLPAKIVEKKKMLGGLDYID